MGKRSYGLWVIFVVLLAGINSNAQPNLAHTWSKVLNNTQVLGGNIIGYSIANDVAGNTYITGSFQNTADFDPGPGVAYLTSFGTSVDIFFAKYDVNGNYVYAKSMGSISIDEARNICVDASGNIYLSGGFVSTVDFDPGPGEANLTASGGYDLYIAKYSNSGNYIYAKAINGGVADDVRSMVLDAAANIYITGFFQGTMDLDPGAGVANLTVVGGDDVYIAKYDNNGNYIYAKAMGGTDLERAWGIAVDGAGNVHIIGSFRGTADFDPGAGIANITSAGIYDVFIAKYDVSGNYIYAYGIGSPNSDDGFGLVTDGSGNVFVTGILSGTADFDPGAGTANVTGGMFIAKYDGGGNYVFATALAFGGVSEKIAIDGSGNICITGYFNSTVDFDPGPGTVNLVSAGSTDLFIAKYDGGGNYVYAKRIGGTGSDRSYSLTLDAGNNMYITGYFQTTVDFDPDGGVVNLVAPGTYLNTFTASYTPAGAYRYASPLGGQPNTTLTESTQEVRVDGSGNVYITGSFLGTVDFDPGPGSANLTSAGSNDIFLAKYDASGNYVYARSFGAIGAISDVGTGLFVDAGNNVYLTGQFGGTIDFDPGAGVANLVSAGNSDVFIAKYDASGNYVYAKNIGGTSNDAGYSIVADISGNVYLTGTFIGTADFDPGGGIANLTSAGSSDIFIAKYDAIGNYVYAKGMGSTVVDMGSCIAVDGSGNVFITGQFQNTADFDPGGGIVNLVSTGNTDIFVAKYDVSGNYVFAHGFGGANADVGNSLAVDAGGNVYATGHFQNTVDFDPGGGIANLVSAGSQDIYIVKYDGSGNYIFAKNMGGTSAETGNSVWLDANGNIYLTGFFQNTVDFDPGAGIANLVFAGSFDTYIAKYDGSGNYIYAKGIGGSASDVGNSISVDASGNVYIAGEFQGTCDFNPNAGTAFLYSLNGYDIFAARYTECTGPFIAGISTLSAPSTISGSTNITDGGCNLLGIIIPAGANPVNGTVSARVWIESSVPTYGGYPFVARHYEFTPATNPSTATGTIILYFTQQEFNDFNAHAGSINDLPANSSDATGKSNLRIGKYSGTSSDGSGLPFTYSGTPSLIDPEDINIIWNTILNRWEVTFDVTGFSGFTVGTSNTLQFCPGGSFVIPAGTNGSTYQWQEDNGGGYLNINNGTNYTGTSTSNLTLINLPTNFYGYRYRCLVDGTPSTVYTVKFGVTWMGNTSPDWHTASNWAGCGVVPDQNTDVEIPAGRTNYPFVNISTTIRSIKLNPVASVNVQAGVLLNIVGQ